MKNIVLVGFMGTGKTAVSMVLADILNMPLINIDSLIEEREGMPINEIFAKKGEAHFRQVEGEVIKEISGHDDTVIDAGGGSMIDEENVKNLRKNGVLLCLNASPEEILKRTSKYSNRPLLNVADPPGNIKELLAKRREYYERADYQIDTSHKDINKVAEEVIRVYRCML
ncbi:MAG: AAA family ATPase [Candidatus Omnitrophica bacterium]|nr:AAA family ATPase [Candidatus Omnitrophota bacterium]